jgi:peptidoglycan/LPS O-acetylase OafA/YrhL
MLQGLSAQLCWNPPTWSISVEFLAYLTFPMLCAGLCRISPLGKAAIGGLLGLVRRWRFNGWQAENRPDAGVM